MSTTTLQFLDSQISYAEIELFRNRHKLLHDCKTKGFSRLVALGSSDGGITFADPTTEPKTCEASRRKSTAAIGSVLVNDGMRITEAAKKCGVTVVALKGFCKRFGFELNQHTERESMCREAIKLVNEGGYRITHAAEKLGTNCNHISNSLARIGYKYDARTIKIEKIK